MCQDVSQAFWERTDMILWVLGRVYGALGCFWIGELLGSLGDAFGVAVVVLGLTLRRFWKPCGPQTGNPQLIVADSRSEIDGFKIAFRGMWKHLWTRW